MEEFWWDLVELLNKPAMVETFVDILLCVVPIWLAIMIGLLIGWSWRPRWTGLVFLGFRHKLRFLWTAVPPGFGARRLWLAFTALSAFSVGHRLWFNFRGRKRKDSAAGVSAVVPAVGSASAAVAVSALVPAEGSVFDVKHSNGITEVLEQDIVTENDLNHLLHLLDGKVAEKSWQSMMERSTSNLIYQAWRHEPERGGPVVYRTRTVFEDATPELVRDFFWDDDFRPRWDPMLAYFKILEEFPHTGTTIVHWIKKFPFFCSDREYIIGRRIWEAGKTFYCVTKGVPYPALQRRNKPRRVDLYFSSWIIKPVLSQKGDGQLSACEVTLVHYEDMGIPKDVARLGVRHGMWATVKKMHSGFRAYQLMRQSQVSLSRSALIARITTKISFKENADSSEIASGEEEKREVLDVHRQRDNGGIDWKWVAIGGAVALVCGLHTGVIGKALLLGAGQKAAQRRAARR